MRSANSQPGRRSALLLAAATAAFTFAGTAGASGPEADYPRVVGDPFVVDGVTYTPVDTLNYDAVGYASIREDGGGIAGSHRTLPLPSYVEVTSLDSGRTILVRLDQRGPMSGPDLLSLSPAAWAQLGLPEGAEVAVRVRRVNPPEAERALLRLGQQAPERMETPKGLLAVLVRKLPSPPPGALVPGIAPAPVATSPVLTVPVAEAAKAVPPPVQPARQQPARPVAKSDSAPAAAEAPVAPPRPVSAPRPEPAATSGVYVQAAAFSSRERADAAAKALGGAVTPAGRLFRVRVGPLASTAEAAAALAKVKAAGYADARVVRAP